jgi:hypothetical protein
VETRCRDAWAKAAGCQHIGLGVSVSERSYQLLQERILLFKLDIRVFRSKNLKLNNQIAMTNLHDVASNWGKDVNVANVRVSSTRDTIRK